MRKHFRRRFRPLTLETSEPRRLLAFAAELVADLDDRPRWFATNPQQITPLGGQVIYAASARGAGVELFTSDGTQAGTRLLKDLLPGPLSSEPKDLVELDGVLFFSAKSKNNGRELWRSDGTAAGTYVFKDIRPGLGDSDPQGLVNSGGTLYFSANDGIHGQELWKSDGTWAGTMLVKDITPAGGSAPRDLTAAIGLVFFTTREAGNRSILWRSDGTAAGTQPLNSGNGTSAGLFHAAEVDNRLFFTADSEATGWELWKTDGTPAGTELVSDLNPGRAGSSLRELTNLNGTLLFRADDGVHGEELWRSDGTPGGTTLVADLNPGRGGVTPHSLINAQGVLYFTDELGRGLWKSNGTAAGTARVYDFYSAGAYANLRYAASDVDGRVYFSADAGDGFEVWRTDGTAAGTVQVKDILPGRGWTHNSYDAPFSSYPMGFTQFGNGVVFSAIDENERHFWFSDGTETGTQRLDDIDPRTPSGSVQGLYNFNGRLFEAADADGIALWIRDAAGVRKLAKTGGGANDFVAIGDTVYFGAAPITPAGTSSGRELWKTDGTAAGTKLVADINPHTYSSRYYPFQRELGSEPSDFVEVNGKIVFAASSRFLDFSKQLWITDGTAAGTTLLKDITVGSSRVDRSFIKLGAHVYFSAREPGGSYQLWRTDGTQAGTVVVKAILPAANQPNPGADDLTLFKGNIFFSMTDAAHGRELWKSDGTAAGTLLVRDIAPGASGSFVHNLVEVGGTLFFTTSSKHNVFSLWKSDGTSGGTVFVADVDTARYFTNVGGTLYFSSNRGGTGYELWQSDGTAAGTRLVKDLIPGAKGSDPKNLQEINGVLFFEATLPAGGRGHWISNGTPAGTYPLNTAGSGLTAQSGLTNVNGTLYFAGTDDVHGQELWRFNTAHPQIVFSGVINYRENEPLRLLAPFAVISDADNALFTGGRLSVVVAENAGASDHIEIRHQGNDPGQIGVSGRTIRYGGVAIGSYRAGLPGSQLIIDLNANASATITQALLRSIGYRNDSDNPGTQPRRVTVTLTDGSGGISSPIGKTINVIAVNDPPRLVLGGQIAYKNNVPPILLAAAATVSDVDSANFLGGMLTVAITSGASASNRLWVSGAFSFSGNNLLRNGVAVGAVIENGLGNSPLKLRFNAKMTAPLVQELVRSLQFRTVNNTSLASRTIEFTLTDGNGGVSATQTKRVNLTA